MMAESCGAATRGGMFWPTSSDHTVGADGRHGKARDGGDHAAQTDHYNTQTWRTRIYRSD